MGQQWGHLGHSIEQQWGYLGHCMGQQWGHLGHNMEQQWGVWSSDGAVMGPFGGILLARIWEMRSRDGILGDTS
jgi:hypothetical protein